MSEKDCTFCKIAGGYELGIVYEEEGVIAFKYKNGRGLVQQQLRPGREVYPPARARERRA